MNMVAQKSFVHGLLGTVARSWATQAFMYFHEHGGTEILRAWIVRDLATGKKGNQKSLGRHSSSLSRPMMVEPWVSMSVCLG